MTSQPRRVSHDESATSQLRVSYDESATASQLRRVSYVSATSQQRRVRLANLSINGDGMEIILSTPFADSIHTISQQKFSKTSYIFWETGESRLTLQSITKGLQIFRFLLLLLA